MDLINHTGLRTAWLAGAGPTGVLGITVIAKGTFTISEAGLCVAAALQLPLFESDQYPGDSAVTAAIVESDYVLFKPRADVVVLGNAYAQGPAATSCEVSITIGAHNKRLMVFGDRVWQADGSISAPLAFSSMPLRFEHAYGGCDASAGADADACYASNPVGRGYFTDAAHAAGLPLPNVEDPSALFVSPPNPSFRPLPQAPAWYGRAWSPRRQAAGRVEQGATALPADFAWSFLNGAHPDLQVPYLRGDERCRLTNCNESGELAFQLPGLRPQCRLVYADDATDEQETALDTLVILSDVELADAPNGKRRWTNAIYIVWRAHLALTAGCTPADVREITIDDRSG